jgi:hypothetical protein
VRVCLCARYHPWCCFVVRARRVPKRSGEGLVQPGQPHKLQFRIKGLTRRRATPKISWEMILKDLEASRRALQCWTKRPSNSLDVFSGAGNLRGRNVGTVALFSLVTTEISFECMIGTMRTQVLKMVTCGYLICKFATNSRLCRLPSAWSYFSFISSHKNVFIAVGRDTHGTSMVLLMVGLHRQRFRYFHDLAISIVSCSRHDASTPIAWSYGHQDLAYSRQSEEAIEP